MHMLPAQKNIISEEHHNSGEEELARALAQYDEAAFKELVNRYKDTIYNVCLGYLHNPQDAEDLAQEVFIQVYYSIDSFRQEASLATWLYKIAVRQSLDLIRYRNRKKRFAFFSALSGLHSPEVLDEADDSEFNHPGIQLENKERAAILFREIARLSEKQQTAFTLNKVSGLSHKEIADVMNLKVPAVESLIHRAKMNLRKQLYAYYQQNELD